MTGRTVGLVSKPVYQCNVNMFMSTLERMERHQVKVDMNNILNMGMCIEEESENDEKTYIITDTAETVKAVVSSRPKRQATQEAKSFIHSTLVKYKKLTLTKPKTPDVLKYVSYFTAVCKLYYISTL